MTNLDPIADLADYQSSELSDSWYHVQPLYLQAYALRNKTQAARVLDTLMTRDWGTAEEPGPSLWVLRGLFSSLFKGSPRVAWIADALEGQGELPPHVSHVFTHTWKRRSSLRDLAINATVKPEGDEAKLYKRLMVSLPDLLRWTCVAPSGLKGPVPGALIQARSATDDENAMPVATQFTGEPYRSFLADLIKPNAAIAPWILEGVLALDPFSDYPAETRERSLVEVAVHYRSDVLKAYAMRFMESEGRLESQGLDVRDRTYPLLMLRKRRYEELKASGVDIHHVDEKGHTYFHHLASSWVPVGFKDGRTYDKEPLEMEADMERILEGWRTLVEMGCDPTLACNPTGKVRLSKSANRKGFPVGWRLNDALPGETAMESLKRRATEGRGTLLPIDLVHRLEASLRDDQAQKAIPLSKPSRPRLRS